MARMTREFSLVLVGSGILTAGYFLYPEDDIEAKQKEQVQQQVAGNNNDNQGRRRHYYGPGFIWIHTGAWGPGGNSASAGRPPAMGGGVARGGFGSIGHASAGS
jgi:hypothetical protein